MNALKTLTAANIAGARRTGRLIVYFLLGVSLALLSVATARWSTEILTALIGGQADADAVLKLMPPADWPEAWAQWIKNLTQILVLVAVVLAALDAAKATSSDSARLIATRPVPRAAQVLSGWLSGAVLLVVGTLAGAVVTGVFAKILWPEAALGSLVTGTAAWFVGALMFTALAALFAILTKSTAASIGLSIGAYVLVTAVGGFGLMKNTPLAIMDLATKLANTGAKDAKDAMVGIAPGQAQVIAVVGGAMLVTAIALWIACKVHGKREL